MKSFFTLGLLAVLTIGCATNPTEPPAPETDPQTESSAPTTELESETETEAGMSTPEEEPAEVAQAEPAVLRTGMFVDGEHPTQGSVQIVEQDGERVLEFG
ncbi:MAG: hypothetical protein AAFX78_17960, partial [Cyanobacteria bacterium J06638_20]